MGCPAGPRRVRQDRVDGEREDGSRGRRRAARIRAATGSFFLTARPPHFTRPPLNSPSRRRHPRAPFLRPPGSDGSRERNREMALLPYFRTLLARWLPAQADAPPTAACAPVPRRPRGSRRRRRVHRRRAARRVLRQPQPGRHAGVRPPRRPDRLRLAGPGAPAGRPRRATARSGPTTSRSAGPGRSSPGSTRRTRSAPPATTGSGCGPGRPGLGRLALLIDHWDAHGPADDYASYAMRAGQPYDVRVEYYEAGGNATARLRWSSPQHAGRGDRPGRQPRRERRHLRLPASTPTRPRAGGPSGATSSTTSAGRTSRPTAPAGRLADAGHIFWEGQDPAKTGRRLPAPVRRPGRGDELVRPRAVPGRTAPTTGPHLPAGAGYDAGSNTTTAQVRGRRRRPVRPELPPHPATAAGRARRTRASPTCSSCGRSVPGSGTAYQPGELFDADVKNAFGRFTTLRYLTANYNAEREWGDRKLPGGMKAAWGDRPGRLGIRGHAGQRDRQGPVHHHPDQRVRRLRAQAGQADPVRVRRRQPLRPGRSPTRSTPA